jgi:hypothetical protein
LVGVELGARRVVARRRSKSRTKARDGGKRVVRTFPRGAIAAAGEVFKTLETTDLRIYKSVSSGS